MGKEENQQCEQCNQHENDTTLIISETKTIRILNAACANCPIY